MSASANGSTSKSAPAVRIILNGYSGQMGAAIHTLAAGDEAISVDACTDFRQPDKERPADMEYRVCMVADAPAAAPEANVIIDFSVPAGAKAAAETAAAHGLAFITGTTGLDQAVQAAVDAAATKVPVVQSGNFSLGVNLLMSLVEKASQALDGFDIEIAETHHRRKVDAPSGTALMLGEAAARARGGALSERAVLSREGRAGPRKPAEIGFSVIRGGGVFGDHDVHFLAEDEIVTLSHRAQNRRLFAHGALVAARWAIGQPAGHYSMRDVLGL